MTNSATKKDVDFLKHVVPDQLRMQGINGNLDAKEAGNKKMLTQALEYLHGIDKAGALKFDQLGSSLKVSPLEATQLRIVTEQVASHSKTSNKERLAGMVVALKLMESNERVRSDFAQHANFIATTS